MYSKESITSLLNRIGFGTMEISVPVDPIHKVGDSGRVLPSFHRLANLRNIFETQENEDITEEEFNAYLAQLKKDAVLSVVNSVFERHTRVNPEVDYSDVILSRLPLFDDAIGFTLATSVIEQMVSTNRSNSEERNARMTYDKLKIELEGLTDGYGKVVSNGLKFYQYNSVRGIINILFPNKLIIDSYQW